MNSADRPLASTNQAPGNRLAGVDGLRAFAASWVVLFHVYTFSGFHNFRIPGLEFFLRSGSTGVSLFLVISGFCLYLPFAGGRHQRFKTTAFLLRRARRLMPAYYAALLAGTAFTLAGAGWLGFKHFSVPDAAWQFVTHLTLTQTLFPNTFYAINGAYWSLGLEWQLYLALPVLIVCIRKFGFARTISGAALVNVIYRLGLQAAIQTGTISAGSLLATAVLPNQLPGRWAEFALGMLAAELFARGHISRWAPRLMVALVLVVPASILLVSSPLSHLFFGLVFFSLLCVVLGETNLISRAFSWRPLVALGVMSYSLYLVHQPLVQAAAYVMRADAHMSSGQAFVGLVLLLPVVVFVGWLLFMGVERWTLTSRSEPFHLARLPGALGIRRRAGVAVAERLAAPAFSATPPESR